MAATARTGAVDKRRLILDAAITVFARQGFHHCRVSDVADEAGVAYGLVYHYFDSKDEVLDTLFLERWNLLLDAIREVDNGDALPGTTSSPPQIASVTSPLACSNSSSVSGRRSKIHADSSCSIAP